MTPLSFNRTFYFTACTKGYQWYEIFSLLCAVSVTNATNEGDSDTHGKTKRGFESTELTLL